MKKTEFERLKRKCVAAEGALDSATSNFATALQPYFKEGITIEHDAADGFIVIMDGGCDRYGRETPCTETIDEVFETISEKSDFYLT